MTFKFISIQLYYVHIYLKFQHMIIRVKLLPQNNRVSYSYSFMAFSMGPIYVDPCT